MFLIPLPNALLQNPQVLINIPLELQPVNPRNRRRSLKQHLFPVNPHLLHNAHTLSASLPLTFRIISTTARLRLRNRQIHALIPPLIRLRRSPVPRLRLHIPACQRPRLHRQRLRMHLPAFLIGLPLDLRPAGRTVVQHIQPLKRPPLPVRNPVIREIPESHHLRPRRSLRHIGGSIDNLLAHWTGIP